MSAVSAEDVDQAVAEAYRQKAESDHVLADARRRAQAAEHALAQHVLLTRDFGSLPAGESDGSLYQQFRGQDLIKAPPGWQGARAQLLSLLDTCELTWSTVDLAEKAVHSWGEAIISAVKARHVFHAKETRP
jgi:hypothetical protein